MDAVVETVKLTKHFGAVRAVHNVTTKVMSGEVLSIMGGNGAGKTTFLNLITGYVKPDSGLIYYQGKDITGYSPRVITRFGIARTFQMAQLYTNMNALDSMLIALASRLGKNLHFWSAMGRGSLVEEALGLLDQFGIKEYANEVAGKFPEGVKKLLDVALSFALKPRLLLMDEPTSGVSTKDKFIVMDTMIDILRRSGTTIVFIEHDVEVVQRYAERVLVFADGEIIADDTPDRVFVDAEVKRILGR